MSVIRAIFRLCTTNWKTLLGYALYGQLIMFIFGGMPNWNSTIVSSVLGIYIGLLVLINRNSTKKAISKKSPVGVLSSISERELNIASVGLGVICGSTVSLLDLPNYVTAFCIGFFVILGMSRKFIEEILP